VKRIFCSLQFLKPTLLAILAAGVAAGQTFVVSPAMVSLSAQAGSTTPVTQVLTIASSGDSAGMHLPFLAFTSPSWLTVTSTPTGTTPASITISADPSGLVTGVNAGQLTIFATNGSPATGIVPVTLTIGLLGAAPSSLSFTYQTGGLVPLPQSLQVTGPSTPTAFTASTSVSSGANWLQVTPTSGTTPESLSVSLVSSVLTTLASGTYNGQVTLTPTGGGGASLNVPVTLTVSGSAQLIGNPASLAFDYQIGGTNNITQQAVDLSSPSGTVNFGAAATVSGGVQWLSVSPTSGATPATLTVTVMPSGLTAGNYSGSITIVAPGTAGLTIDVSLLVSDSPLISFSTGAVDFTYQVGTPSPASQLITTASTGAAISYTVAGSTASGGNWLAVSGSGTTPTPITVAVNPAGLNAGTYSGTITVTAAGAGNSPQQIPVTLTVTNNALVAVAPTALNFTYEVSKALPISQALAVSSTGGALNYTATATTTSGGAWLWVAPNMATTTSGTTPGTVSVTVQTNGLAPGTYHGTVTVTATGADGSPVSNSPITIPVTYYVSDDALLQVLPAALTFTASTGGVAPVQTVTLTSTSDVLSYTVTSTTSSGGFWLSVGAQPGMTPGSFFVSAAAIGLASGTYTGSIVITATNSTGPPVTDSPFTIPVTFQVISGTLTVAPASLTFNQVVGGSAPPAQTVNVGNAGSGTLNFTVTPATATGGNWLTVTPVAGGTPATINISVNAGGLAVGTYTGSITITSQGANGSPQIIPVTLNVQAVTLTLTPAALTFNYTMGEAAPASQEVMVASSAGALAFTAAAATNAGSGNWLSVSPASGTTPGTLTVTVNPASLAVGMYTGTVTVTAGGAGNSPQMVNVTLNVAAPIIPTPVIMSVKNSGSYALGAVAPGEIVSIFGSNLGPADGVTGTITDNMLTTELANVTVMFDNNPAPLLYVSATQINAVVPFEVSGRSHTQLVVANTGMPSSALDLMVAGTAPGLFTAMENGAGEGAILNQDGSVNSSDNPAAKGSVIVLYVSGGGQTDPAGVTGHITPSDGTGLKMTVAGVSATVGGLPATVVYHGSAPGFVEGALQVNVQMSPDVASGPQPVVLTIGGVMSQSNVTVAVQ
jgi:uncharacterized protein (TIGR03437 family)